MRTEHITSSGLIEWSSLFQIRYTIGVMLMDKRIKKVAIIYIASPEVLW